MSNGFCGKSRSGAGLNRAGEKGLRTGRASRASPENNPTGILDVQPGRTYPAVG